MTEVYRHDGTLQCRSAGEIPLSEMKAQLEALGATVVSCEKRMLPFMLPQVCDSKTGWCNVFLLAEESWQKHGMEILGAGFNVWPSDWNLQNKSLKPFADPYPWPLGPIIPWALDPIIPWPFHGDWPPFPLSLPVQMRFDPSKRLNIPTWHKIRIDKESHPRSYKVKTGDLVQCYLDFGLPSEPSLPEMKVNIDNFVMTEIGVIPTPDLNKEGSGQLSAFFFIQEEGLCHIRFTPDVPGKTTKEYNIAFLAMHIETREGQGKETVPDRGGIPLEITENDGVFPMRSNDWVFPLKGNEGILPMVIGLSPIDPSTSIGRMIGKKLRVYREGDAITKDLDINRVNIELHRENDIVLNVWFG